MRAKRHWYVAHARRLRSMSPTLRGDAGTIRRRFWGKRCYAGAAMMTLPLGRISGRALSALVTAVRKTPARIPLTKLFRDGFQISVAEDAAAEPGQTVAHTTLFVLIDGDGRIRGYYHGDDPASLDKLAADASRL